MRNDVILICGLNGAGKSTLARAVAERLSYRCLDIEALYFPKTDQQDLYAKPRSFHEVEEQLLEKIMENDTMVLASVDGKFNEEITSHFQCIFYLEVDKEERLNRVYHRSYLQFQERMMPGGDLYEKEKAFYERVKNRQDSMVLDWLKTVSAPVVTLDGTKRIEENADEAVKIILSMYEVQNQR